MSHTKKRSSSSLNKALILLDHHKKSLVIRVFSVFILFAALIYTPASVASINHIIYKAAFTGIGVGILMLFWFLSGWQHKHIQWLKSPTTNIILAFLIWSTASLIWTTNINYGLDTLMYWLSCALFFCIILNCLETEDQFTHLLASIYMSGLLIALIGIQQHFYPAWATKFINLLPEHQLQLKAVLEQIFSIVLIEQVVPPASTFANKNMAIHYIMLILPLGFSFFLSSKKKSHDWFFALSITLIMSYIIYTKTRAGWLILAIQLLLFMAVIMIETRKSKKCCLSTNKWLAIIVSTGLLFISANINPQTLTFSWASNNLIAEAQTIYTHANTQNVRIGMWQEAISMISAHPILGVGVGNYELITPLHQSYTVESQLSPGTILYHPHNDILEITAEVGLIGITLLFILIGLTLKTLLKLCKKLEGQTRFLCYGLAIAIISIAINAQFSFPLQRVMPLLILMTYLACICALYHRHVSTAPPQFINVKGYKWYIAVVIVLSLLVAAIIFHSNRLTSNKIYGIGMKIAALEASAPLLKNANLKDKPPMKISINGLKEAMLEKISVAAKMNDIFYIQSTPIWIQYLKLGRPEKAIEAYKEITKRYPFFNIPWLGLAESYRKNQQNHEAIMAFNQMLSFRSQYQRWAAHLGLAKTFEDYLHYTHALKQYQLAQSLVPKEAYQEHRRVYNLWFTLNAHYKNQRKK